MSVNKILALIGAILYSLYPVVLIGIGSFVSFAISQSSGIITSDNGMTISNGSITINGVAPGTNQNVAEIIITIFIILAVMALALVVVNWIGFTKMDSPKEKNWKIYFLVIGILSALSGNIVCGVLFILAYALKGSAKQQSPVEASMS